MLNTKRLGSIARYLTHWADPPTQWRVSMGDCPMCGRKPFASLGAAPVMVRCLSCRATVGNLSLIPVIKHHLGAKAGASNAYELSSYGVTLEWLRKNLGSVTVSEFFPGQPLGQIVNGYLNQDVHSLTFPDNSFDLVTSNYVFEHVEDDLMGFREIYRVLKPGGAMILSIPLYDTPATERAAKTINGNIIFCGEPEYHDSRFGGPMSAPVFWRHSINDIRERVRSAGFPWAELREIRMAACQRDVALVVYAGK